MQTIIIATRFARSSMAILIALLLTLSTLAQDDYQYDLNGNLAKDRNKGLDTIIYNSLNLVEKVVFTGGKGSVSYSYDALGNKLSKTVVDHPGSSTSTKTTSYVEGVEYDENQALQFVTTEEGRVVPNGPAFQYEYNLTDHLGNVRVRFMEHPDTHQPQVLQTQGYYPFGGEQASMSFASGTANKYLYSGKELQEELALYDFGARMYDPWKGRWNGVDPLAEKYYNISPYAYVANNPLKHIDPDGKRILIWWKSRELKYLEYKDGKLFYPNGESYNGKDAFPNRVKDHLNELSKDASLLETIVTTLQGSKNIHLIKEGENMTTPVSREDMNNNISTGSVIEYNSADNQKLIEKHKLYPKVFLAHELAHAFDMDLGVVPKTTQGLDIKPDAKEYFPINVENLIRAVVGAAKRTSYTQPIPKELLWDTHKDKDKNKKNIEEKKTVPVAPPY